MADYLFFPKVEKPQPKKPRFVINQKYIWILVSVLVIGGGGYFIWDAIFYKTHKDYYNKISLKYPSKWSVEEEVNGAIVVFKSPPDSSADLFNENVNLDIKDMSASPMNLKDYTDLAVKQLEGLFKNIRIVESSEATLAGLPAYKIVYDVKAEIDLKLMHVWTIFQNKAYTLTFAAESDHYTPYLKEVNYMISSFRILE